MAARLERSCGGPNGDATTKGEVAGVAALEMLEMLLSGVWGSDGEKVAAVASRYRSKNSSHVSFS